MAPSLIFGTASFGMDQTEFQDKASIVSLLQVLQSAGINRLDSGARYPPRNPGQAERLIGECKSETEGFAIDTKIYTDTASDGSGDLTAAAIETSVSGSLGRLSKPEGVNVLHIHRADPATPIREQVKALDNQIKKGACRAWGLSNVPLPMFKEMLRVCEEDGLQKPVCYQGEYNVITRGAEKELLPLLREHGVAFNAFRPLASGFMTSKFVQGTHAGTRFGDDNPLGKFAQRLFGDESLHTAMKAFDKAVTAEDATTLEVAIRWLVHHSALKDADGIVMGASKTSQVTSFVDMLRKGPLPPQLLAAAENLWKDVEPSRHGIL